MAERRELNFPKIKLRARQGAAGIEVWDELRRMWLVLTPEERVRRHLLAFLVAQCRACAHRIVQEYPVPINGQPQRADVVVVDAEGRPLLLAECKAPEVNLDSDAVVRQVVAQAVRYNSVLGARYVVVTNGLRHLCYEQMPDGQYLPLACFPQLIPDEV